MGSDLGGGGGEGKRGVGEREGGEKREEEVRNCYDILEDDWIILVIL